MMNALRAVPAMPVRNIDASVAFYRDTVGFEPAHHDEGFAIVRQGPVDLHLWLASDDAWKQRSSDMPVVSGAESFLAGTASCRIQVDDVEGLFTRLDAAGVVHPNGSLKHTEWNTREFAIIDPDNNLITFYEAVDAPLPSRR